MVAAVNLTRDTLKTYFRRIIDKLVLDGQPGLVRFASEMVRRGAADWSS